MTREGPSATAIIIALSLLALRARRGGAEFVDEQDARLLARALRDLGGLPRLLGVLATLRSAGPLVRLIEWCFLPGIITHFAVRKGLIEESVERAITTGVEWEGGRGGERVVVLGAGLDLLTRRLASRHPRLSLVEIDRPATVRFKERMLCHAGDAEGRITLIPADLAGADLGALLTMGGPAATTVFVAEGLTMYLTAEEVGALLERLAGVPGAARFVFTFLEQGSDGRAAFPRQGWVLSRFLRASRERFQWGCAHDRVGAFVGQHGWELRRVLGPGAFGPGFTGEFIAECERAPAAAPSTLAR